MSGRIIDYFGSGLAAARPATPAISSGGVAFWRATDTGALSVWDASGGWNTIGGGTAAALNVDTDGTLAANSDTLIATQKAVKTAIAAAVTGLWEIKGAQDCSANPNYPAASKGDAYVVTVAGKIGGASGIAVDVGDVFIAFADNAGGTQASVGASWFMLEHNIAATTVGGNLFALANPSAITFLRVNADNSVTALSASAFRTAIGAGTGTGSGDMIGANNLTDVASIIAAVDHLFTKGADVASAATTDLATATGNFVDVTGTTTITALGTLAAGVERTVRFTGVLTLTYNATSLILPTAANIATAAGDIARFRSLGSGNWVCVAYQRVTGQQLAAPQIQPVTSSATVTPTFANDQVIITAQAAGLTLANPTGTAVDGWGIAIRIKDNGTARSISYGTQYRAIGVTLPTTTVISKTLYLGMIFNNADTKWDVVAVAQEA